MKLTCFPMVLLSASECLFVIHPSYESSYCTLWPSCVVVVVVVVIFLVDPVDAPGYYKVIKTPMDFGTVRVKLEVSTITCCLLQDFFLHDYILLAHDRYSFCQNFCCHSGSGQIFEYKMFIHIFSLEDNSLNKCYYV